MCILLVDHQTIYRKGIINVLSTYIAEEEIIEADNRMEADRILQKGNISTVFMGLQLEKEKGYDLVKYIKDTNKNTKVIILNHSKDLQDFVRVRNLGIEGYLLKDAKSEDLIYAYQVVQRGDYYYSNLLIEKSILKSEPKELNILTDREKEVFQLLCQGLSNHEIGKTLFITEATTKKHISSIMNKLHFSKRIEAIFYANKLYNGQFQLRG